MGAFLFKRRGIFFKLGRGFFKKIAGDFFRGRGPDFIRRKETAKFFAKIGENCGEIRENYIKIAKNSENNPKKCRILRKKGMGRV